MIIKKQSKKYSPHSRDFEQRIEDCYKRLHRTAWYFTGNREDAQDLVQETFTQAFRSYHSFQGKSALYTWLYGIFRNVRRNMERRKALHVNRFGSIEAEKSDDIRFAAPDNPYTLIVESELYHSVHHALMKLPEKYREVLLLKHFEDFSYNEIARILECSVGTVKSRIFTARQLLKKEMR